MNKELLKKSLQDLIMVNEKLFMSSLHPEVKAYFRGKRDAYMVILEKVN